MRCSSALLVLLAAGAGGGPAEACVPPEQSFAAEQAEMHTVMKMATGGQSMDITTVGRGAIYYDNAGKRMRQRIDTQEVEIAGGMPGGTTGGGGLPGGTTGGGGLPSFPGRKLLAARLDDTAEAVAERGDLFGASALAGASRTLLQIPKQKVDVNMATLLVKSLKMNFTWSLKDPRACICGKSSQEFPVLTLPPCDQQGTFLDEQSCGDKAPNGCTKAFESSIKMPGFSLKTKYYAADGKLLGVDSTTMMDAGGAGSTDIVTRFRFSGVKKVENWDVYEKTSAGNPMHAIAKGAAFFPPEGCAEPCIAKPPPPPPPVPDPPAKACPGSPPDKCRCPETLTYCSMVDYPTDGALDLGFTDTHVQSSVESVIQMFELIKLPMTQKCKDQIKRFYCAFHFQRCSEGGALQLPCAGMFPGGTCGECEATAFGGIAIPKLTEKCTTYGELACESSTVKDADMRASMLKTSAQDRTAKPVARGEEEKTKKEKTGKKDGSAMIGIVAGALVGVGIAAAAAFFVLQRNSANKSANSGHAANYLANEQQTRGSFVQPNPLAG